MIKGRQIENTVYEEAALDENLCAHSYVDLDVCYMYIFLINVLCSASRKESLRITKTRDFNES